MYILAIQASKNTEFDHRKGILMKISIKNYALLNLILTITLLYASPVRAALVTYAYEGSTGQAVGPDGQGIEYTGFADYENELLRVEYTFDTNAVDLSIDSTRGSYSILSANVTMGELTYSLDPNSTASRVEIANDPDFDHYTLHIELTGPDIFRTVVATGPGESDVVDTDNPLSPSYFFLSLVDFSATAFSSDALPSTQPSSTDFRIHDMGIVFSGVEFIESFPEIAEVTVVPVPTAIWLFGTGLLGLVGVAKRKKV